MRKRRHLYFARLVRFAEASLPLPICSIAMNRGEGSLGHLSQIFSRNDFDEQNAFPAE
jgi:hypothetical protein